MKRKLLTGLLGIVLLSLCNAVAEAQIVYKAYEINEDFESLTVGDTWGFENQIQPAVSDAPIAPHTGNVLQWSFINQSGSRTGYKDFTAIAIPEDGILKLDFDWHLGVPTNKNTSGVFFRFKDAAGNISIAFSTASNNGGSGNALHYVNLDNGVTNDATAASTLIAPTGGNFARDSWVSIHASLNFNTKIVDTLIVTNGTATYTNYGTTFYSDQASTISRFEVYLQRDGQNGGWTGQIDNFQIYRYEEVAGTADVTVKFKDQDDNEFKTEEIISDLAIGVTYNATIAQKASVKDVDDYYTLDPSSLTSVEVAAGGSTLTLQFRKAPYFSAVTWNGTAEANTWNEWDTFFLNETTETAYQKDAQVTFDATAAEKTVLVNEAIDLGAGNVTISGSGYSFTGNGQLVGTGAININLSGEDAISLGVTNSLTGATQIAGGTVTLAKNGVLGTGIVVNGGATFVPSVNDIAFPAATFNANAAIQVGNLRTSISDITIPEGVKVSVSSAYNTNNDFAFGFAATGTIASGAELELNGTAAETKFGMTSASANYLANAKVTLKGTAFLYIEANQGASTTINVGTLAGEADTKLGWGRSSDVYRDITWSVGALNEDSEFAGSITNVGGYRGSGEMYTGNNVHFIKAGTGTLTLSGTSSNTGNVAVNGGTLNVTGSLPATAPVTVGTDATLKGTGTIGANTTVNGTLEGNLSFGGDVNLASTATLKITVDDSDADAVTIAGTFTTAGTLEVIETAVPEASTTYKIIDAETYAGSFATVVLPDGTDNGTYSFDAETGVLSYTKKQTGIEFVNGINKIISVEYYDASGQRINENVRGFIIKKTIYDDGSMENRKVINK